jgi:glycosyltransferase involved in cell wall biosynthesis
MNNSADVGRVESSRPIALFIPNLGGGGAQRVMVSLANAFVSLTARPVHLVVATNKGPFRSRVESNVEVFDLGVDRTLASVGVLRSYLRRYRPVVLMSTLNYANVIAAAAHWLAGVECRLVLREANVFVPNRNGLRASIYHRALQMCMQLFYCRAHAVIANSIDTLLSLKRAHVFVGENPFVIPNPVDVQPVVWQGGTCGNARYICAIGRLVHQKGFDVLIRAFAKMEARNARLVILGEGPLRKELADLAEVLGVGDRVSMPGFVEEPWQILANASVFALSSRWEGFGNVLVEALAVGVPIVATDCPGGPRDILDGGRYGMLVPVDDVTALSEALDRALANPVGTEASRRQRAKEFSVAEIAPRYLRVLLDGIECNST